VENVNTTPTQLLLGVRGEAESAESMYRLSLEIDPRNVSALCALGDFEQSIHGDYDEAAVMFQRALEADPGNKDIVSRLRGLVRKGMSSQPPNPAAVRAANACGFCGVSPCTVKCGGCGVTYYCSKDHQQKEWKRHKKQCKKAGGGTAPPP
jgi:tetratricopeptide (TPR) repeat protein